MAKRKAPGHKIAELVSAGQLDGAGALAAVEQVVRTALGPEDDEDEGNAHRVDEEELQQREDEKRRSRVAALGHRLNGLAAEQVQLRQQTEERWYQDVRQFNGQYDPKTFAEDESAYGSRVFVPLTRRLVNLCEARLFDMLFPSDERNFILEPTPVPDMDQAGELAEKLPAGQQIATPEGTVTAGAVGSSIKQLKEEAGKRADAMQREIDDQLAECRYTTHARNVIHDAVMMGTGILKGPTPLAKMSKRWKYNPATGKYSLQREAQPAPVAVRVDPWNFFPDMSATTIEEAEFAFERHFLTKKQTSELQDMEYVDKDALRQVLGAAPTVTSSNHRERLRAINGANGAPDKRYEVWEYHGPLSVEDLRDCGCKVEDDPLIQYTGIVLFCNGVVLKAALNPMDTGAMPYRVFTWQKDESNIFGFGLPYEVRDTQEAANSSFRAMLDNMGLSVKPIVVCDPALIEPMHGTYELIPGAFFQTKSPNVDVQKAFKLLTIESRLEELQNIFVAAKTLIEEVGTMPAFLQGQDAPGKVQSATEASISWTAANLWVRRCVRNWDDDITTPMIGDFFDWNMQHSKKAEIKGDSKVKALGIAALVELEGQAQKMQQFITAAKAMGVPISSQLLMLRQFARAFKLDPDTVLPTEQEIQKMREAEAKNPPVDVEQKKVEVAQENNQLDAKSAAEQIQLRREEMAARREEMSRRENMMYAQIASNERISVEEARSKYGFETQKVAAEMQDHDKQRGHEAQMFNAESSLRVQTGAGV